MPEVDGKFLAFHIGCMYCVCGSGNCFWMDDNCISNWSEWLNERLR